MRPRLTSRVLRSALALLLVLSVAGQASAGIFDLVYGTTFAAPYNITTIDQGNGTATTVFAGYPPGASGSAAMAQRANDGMLFYITGTAGNDRVYRWNPATPAVAPVFLGTTGTGVAYLPRLAFAQNDVLYAINTSGATLYTLDQTTGAATAIATYTNPPAGGGDFTFAPDGTLFLVTGLNLWEMPLAGGAAINRGAITGATGSMVGMAYNARGENVIINSANPATVYTLNITTRVATQVGVVGAAGSGYGDLGSAPGQYIRGKVFEDVTYAGGIGRSNAAASGVGRPNARVELYDNLGNFVISTVTDASGNYELAGASSHVYTVRVVGSTVSSSRAGATPGLLPVQTYRTDAVTRTAVPVTDRVGGENPSLSDAGNGSTTLAALTTATTTAQSITTVTTGNTIGGTIVNVDFGFNFNTIVNVNDAGHGSLRSFIINSNGMTGADTSVFMISDGAAHPGLRAGLANQLTGGVARIVPTTALPTITDAGTTIDGSTQTALIGNTNAAAFGAGGTAGVDNLPIATVAGPEVEIRSGAVIPSGLVFQGSGAVVRALAILGFGAANGEAGIKLVAGATGALIENTILGSAATAYADPGTALRNYEGVDADGATGGTIRNNLISFNGRRGIFLQNSATGWTVTGNEIRDNGLADPDGDGISITSATATVTGNRITGTSSQGIAITSSTGNVFNNNTLSGNGVGTSGSLLQSSGISLRTGNTATTFDRNVITANYGAGLTVNNGSTGIYLTRNSFFDNGTISARTGAAASNQIGIDLNSPTDDQSLGSAPFYTQNAAGARTGGNSLFNFPVVTNATIVGGNLVLTGFAKPGSVIELFVGDADPSGFGEGKTYLTTLTEGSGTDTDNGTGTYNNPVNGLNQGTDTTNRFTFSIPLPGGVSAGTRITATASLSGQTSEFSGIVTVAAAGGISGNVFEDVNYGGGAGRDLATSSGIPRPGATVELYNTAGAFLSSTTTDAAGLYTFPGLSAANYTVRVVNSSVTSSRTGYIPALLPVQTFRTSGLTGTVGTADPNRVGGENPAVTGAGAAAAGSTMDTTTGVFTAGIAGQAQSITTVAVGTTAITGIDFGFNFNAIVNTNDSGQGSLRQFILNANALGNAGLAQQGQPAGKEATLFMVSNGTAQPGLRAGLANQLTAGVARITLASALPAITGTDTVIDGATQTTNIGNTNAVVLGTGGTVGVDTLALPTVAGPEVEIRNGAGLNAGLSLQAANLIVRNIAISGFGNAANANGHANLLLNSSAANALIEQNIIGTSATAFVDPGAGARSGGNNVHAESALNGTIRNNLIGFSAGKGIELNTSANGWTVTGNELRGNGIGNPNLDGIDIENSSGSTTIIGNLAVANQGVGFDSFQSSGGNNITNNTSINNGFGTGANEEDMGIRIFGAGNVVSRNIVSGNSIAGIAITAGASGTVISRNSLFGNGAIGIDLHAPSDNAKVGTSPYVTLNDPGDADTGANGLLNFPILSEARIVSGNLVLKGFARPGAAIELFLAEALPGGFGEGKTYLVTVTEGSAADLDTTTGNYTNPVNGLNQGTDTTNRFEFSVPLPAGVSLGTLLTATATLAGATSEFSGNIAVAAAGVELSGFAYEDANFNLLRDSAEAGTALTLFVKLIDTASPAGPALAAAAVDPVTGTYVLNNVLPGLYTLILDDNNTLTDIAPTLPAGWTGTQSANGIRTPVSAATVPVPNQDFGLYHGILVTGRVFNDNGAGSGIANDGTLNGGEAGLGGVTLSLTNAAGTVVHSTATSNAAGEYALALPSTIAVGSALKIVETNGNGFVSTGATVGNTGGTYDRATDAISFTLVANTAYANANFGDVGPSTLNTDGQQAGLPGTVLFYPHTFTAATAGSVVFAATNTQAPAFPGWTSTLYRDTNANGQFDAGEPIITGPIAVAAGEIVAVLVKQFIPTNAPFGAGNEIKLNATLTYTGASPALSSVVTRTDVTTVGNPTTAGLRLNKTVDKPSALPGATITYTISYANNSTDDLRNVIIYDTTPAFTTFVSGTNGPLPPDLTAVVLAAPAPGATGAMRWTFTGTLRPGATGTVSFTVQLAQ